MLGEKEKSMSTLVNKEGLGGNIDDTGRTFESQ